MMTARPGGASLVADKAGRPPGPGQRRRASVAPAQPPCQPAAFGAAIAGSHYYGS
jgi:hypothetical protein